RDRSARPRPIDRALRADRAADDGGRDRRNGTYPRAPSMPYEGCERDTRTALWSSGRPNADLRERATSVRAPSIVRTARAAVRTVRRRRCPHAPAYATRG